MNKIISINELWKFFNQSATLFCITSADGYLTQVNPHVISLLGFSEQELLSTPYLNFIHKADRANSIKQSGKIRNIKPVVQFRNRLLTATGEYKWISWTATFVPAENNVYLIGQDYSETQLMERNLRKERINKHNSVLEATVVGQEKERTEIGKELHDNINQMLASANLYLQMARTEKDHSEEHIVRGTEIIVKVINEIRHLSKSLVGPDTRQIGLVDCISELADTIKAGTKIKVEFSHSEGLETLQPDVKLTVYRVIQEQVNNIIKHANAANIVIHLERTDQGLYLLVSDDGPGFDVAKKRNGIGLNNILSRVAIHRGKLKIDSSPGKGCCLTVTFPASVLRKG